MSTVIITFEGEKFSSTKDVKAMINTHNEEVENHIDKMISMIKARAYSTYKVRDNWFEKLLRKIHNRRKNCNDVEMITPSFMIELIERMKGSCSIEIVKEDEHKNQLKLF